MKAVGVLHVLTDTVLQQRYSHEDLARLAVAGGADTIQYRRKTGSTREMIEEAKAVLAVCRARGVPLIVNDRVDVAVAAGADGVHLGQEDFPVRLARELLGPDRTIGVSGGTLEEARQGAEDGADYVGFGPIYATGSKADARQPRGLEALSHVTSQVSLPVIAIGGVGVETAAEVVAAGAYGIAVISAVCCAGDPGAATRELAQRVRGERGSVFGVSSYAMEPLRRTGRGSGLR